MSSWHIWQACEPTYSAGWVAAGGGAGAPGLSWAPHMVAVNSAAMARSTTPRAFLTGRNMSVISFILLAGVFFIYIEVGAGSVAHIALGGVADRAGGSHGGIADSSVGNRSRNGSEVRSKVVMAAAVSDDDV